jgi:hypothetical protein
VVAIVGNGSIRLRWQRPPGVVRVVVLRVSGGRTVRQYRGPGLTFVDRGVRSGRTYRYVLVSYDRAGRSSAGVITIIRPRTS